MERLHRLNLWTLEERRIHADLIEVYKMINGITSVKFESFFEFDSYSRTWDHSYKLKKNRFNTELRQHFFTERIVNIWNKLDEQTVTASSLNCFKRNLDRLRNSTQMGLFLDWCLKTLGADLAQPVKPRPVSDPVSDPKCNRTAVKSNSNRSYIIAAWRAVLLIEYLDAGRTEGRSSWMFGRCYISRDADM